MSQETVFQTFLLLLTIIVGRMVSLPLLFVTFYRNWHATKLHYSFRMCFMNYLTSLVVSNFWNSWAIFHEYYLGELNRKTHIYLMFNFIEFSTILWTNVLCFVFWQSIRNLLPRNASSWKTTKYLIYVCSSAMLYTTVDCINEYLLEPEQRIYQIIRWLLFAYPVIVLFSNELMLINVVVILLIEMRDKNTAINYRKHIVCGTLLMVTIQILFWSEWILFRLNYILQIESYYCVMDYMWLIFEDSFRGVLIYFLFAFKTKSTNSGLLIIQTVMEPTSVDPEDKLGGGDQVFKNQNIVATYTITKV